MLRAKALIGFALIIAIVAVEGANKKAPPKPQPKSKPAGKLGRNLDGEPEAGTKPEEKKTGPEPRSNEPLIPVIPEDFELVAKSHLEYMYYMASKQTMTRNDAFRTCAGYTSKDPFKSRKAHIALPSIPRDGGEHDLLRNGMGKLPSVNCLWIAAQYTTEDGGKTWIINIPGFNQSDVNGGSLSPGARRKRGTTIRRVRQQEGEVHERYWSAATDVHYPYVFKEGSGWEADGNNLTLGCPNEPRCPPINCTVKTPDCDPVTYGCDVDEETDCEIVKTNEICQANCQNCTVQNPTCEVVQEPCQVTSGRNCRVVQGQCTSYRPPCTIERPTCYTKQPPCNITEPVDTCTDPKCYVYPVDLVRLCAQNQNLRGCHDIPQICLKPRYCKKAKIFCPPAQTFCPPERLRCEPINVTCSEPKVVCDPPSVFCPPPKVQCTQPVVNCNPPVVSCPTAVASCKHTEIDCPDPKPQCPEPEVNCEYPTECIPIPPPDNTCGFECNEECQCSRLQKQKNWDAEHCSCDEQCHALCEVALFG